MQPFLSVTLCRSFEENIGSCVFSLIVNIVICLSYCLTLVFSAGGCVSFTQSLRTQYFSSTYFPRYFWRFLIKTRRI